MPVSDELVAAQQAVLDVAHGAPASLVGERVRASEWFLGLRFVAALHRMFAPPEQVAACPGMPAEAAEAFAVAAQRRTGLQAVRVRIPPNAAHAAADLLVAHRVLAAPDPGVCAELLMPVAEAEAAMLETAAKRQDRMWPVRRPEILDRVWRAIRRSRHRAFDPTVRRVPRSRPAAGLEVRHIPQLIDTSDYRELLAPLLPELTPRSGRRLSAAACARVLGARSWDHAAEALGLERGGRSVAQHAGLIRRVPQEARFWEAIAIVIDRLAARGPIDYAARRLGLADLTEVPTLALAAFYGEYRTRIGQRQCRFAAAWIWAELTSGDLVDAPATLAVPLRGQQRRWDSTARRRFTAHLPTPVADALCRHGSDLLVTRGIP